MMKKIKKIIWMKKIYALLFLPALILLPCGGCAVQRDAKPEAEQGAAYTLEELGNLAQLEIYLPGDDEPVKIITDEEILYQYNQCPSLCVSNSEPESEERQEELRKAAASAAEKCLLVAYKYPVSRFHKAELEKSTTITLYEDINIIKTEVSEESIKGADIPAEYLTFYSEIPREELEFYQTLAGKS